MPKVCINYLERTKEDRLTFYNFIVYHNESALIILGFQIEKKILEHQCIQIKCAYTEIAGDLSIFCCLNFAF